MQKLSRRQILKAISALPAVSPATSVLAQAANPQPQEWTGFAICDSCNHVPSCGIQFQAQGNNIISIQNWKENPRHWLCSKGMSTLQRLYNPNRLLYPMKRTAPKGAEDPGWVRIPGMRLTRPSLPTCSPPKRNTVPNPSCSMQATRKNRDPLFIVWLVISTLPLGPRNPLPLAAPAA